MKLLNRGLGVLVILSSSFCTGVVYAGQSDSQSKPSVTSSPPSNTVITVIEDDESADDNAELTQNTQQTQENQAENEDEAYWEIELGFMVGVGRAVVGSLNQSEQGYLIHGPWFAGGYYNGDFFVESDPGNAKPLTLGYTAYETEQLQVNVIATPFYMGFQEAGQQRGDMLTDLDDRNPSFDAGVEILATYKYGQVGVRVLNDIFNSHSGHTFDVMYGYPVYLDKTVLWPAVGVTYVSNEVNDYYYSIRPHEVRDDRPAYKAGAGFSAKFNLYFEHELTQRTSMIGFSQISILNDEVYNSPLVDHRIGFNLGIGMIWIF